MALKLLFLMDPIERINIDADSTFVLMLESNARRHEVFYAEISALELLEGAPFATVRPAVVRRKRPDHYELGEPVRVALNDMDAIFMRKDPPVDTNFFMATLVLDRVDESRVVMVNRSRTLRDWNEKLAALHFPELMPPTLVSADRARLRGFVEEVEHAVVKPLNGAGGFGVLRVGRGDMNLGSAIDLLTNEGRTMIEAQAFIGSVSEGDKRIILLDGEPIGAVNRRPRAGDLRANLHVGGAAEKAILTDRDREICDALRPELIARGLIFVGIDVIGGYLTEINVTSPTGLQEIDRLDGVSLEALIIDAVERKRLS
jgi:glutathione synthase